MTTGQMPATDGRATTFNAPGPGGAFRPHGGVRGDQQAPGSALFEGRFGRMFRRLAPANHSEADLTTLATAITAKAEDKPTPETEIDDEENQGIDAGYTYLGQFIDHDLTFDPNSSLQRTNDPDALTDFRTPRFDLDCIYGRGPNDQPYLYEDGGLRMKLGRPLTGAEDFDANARDVPRHGLDGQRKRALIGDPRNDENVLVSQLQSIMLRFHNRLVDVFGATSGADFEFIQQMVRWHYQWVVLHEFLPTIVGHDTLDKVLPHLSPDAAAGGQPYHLSRKSIYDHKPILRFFEWANNPFIPIEFSAAAYRFGHSMIRPIYRLNLTLTGGDPAINGRKLIFTPEDGTDGLNGFREFPDNWAIDWRLFFDMGENRPKTGVDRLQKSYKIDSSVVNPLSMLPTSVASDDRSLIHRNLLRGMRMGLPTGQAVANYMDVDVIKPGDLRVGKATEDGQKKNKTLAQTVPAFDGNAPLWYYILAEAQQAFRNNDTPIRLGKVGGRIVTEVFVGLLLGDKNSFLSQFPGWEPDERLCNPQTKNFQMADLIRAAVGA